MIISCLEQLVFRIVLHEVGVDPPLPVGQAVPRNVQRVLSGLKGKLDATDLGLEKLVLA
jgi:hypothetical protein